MSLFDDLLDIGLLLDVHGDAATYRRQAGPAVEMTVVINRDIQVVDETGSYSRQAMALFRSGLVTPATGDWIDTGSETWDVEQLTKDDGHTTQVIVRPRP